jgi:hypothetical protein
MRAYIKGMEMPITCCHCPMMGYDPDIEWNDGGRETQGAYVCVLTHELIDNTKREEHCPLVPVPPHGDLIDRNELIENCMKEDSFLAELLFRKVSNAPTIIPAEEGEA